MGFCILFDDQKEASDAGHNQSTCRDMFVCEFLGASDNPGELSYLQTDILDLLVPPLSLRKRFPEC